MDAGVKRKLRSSKRKDASKGDINLFVSVVGLAIAATAMILLPAAPDNPNTGPSKVTRKANPIDLFRWVKKHGAYIHPAIKIDTGARGRGIFFGRPVEHSELLYEVPETLWISEATLKGKSSFAVVLKDPEFHARQTSRKNHALIAFALLFERNNPKSFWRPYIDTLPQYSPDNPAQATPLWTKSMMAELQSPDVIHQWNLLNEALANTYSNVAEYIAKAYPKIFQTSNYTLEDFLHLYFLVASRAFDCSLPTAEGYDVIESKYHHSRYPQTCLIPFVDLVNHDSRIENHNTMTLTMPAKIAMYTVMAHQNFERGAEMLQSYGGDPDRLETTFHYIRAYGFVNDDLSNTQGDYITVEVSAEALDSPIISIVEGSGRPRKDLLEKISELVANGNGDTAQAANIVQKAASTTLSSFATTLGEDMEILNSDIENWKRAAIFFRIRFKKILHKILEPEMPFELLDGPEFPTWEQSPEKLSQDSQLEFAMNRLRISL